jgi:pimeloyl-ACP methyl ester carboxylesterase
MKIGGDANKSIIYGWSQGGGAVLAAAGMPEYLSRKGTAEDQIKIAGVVAMAPQDLAALATDSSLNSETADKLLNSLITSFTDNVFNFSHLSMNLWANSVAFPELKLTDIFTEEGAKLIDTLMQNKCVHVLSDTLNFTFGNNFKSLLKPKPDNTLAWAKALIDGSAPTEKSVAPVVIYWGDKDTVVPPAMGKAYRDKMCRLGANVSRVKLPGEQNHFTTPSVAQPLYLKWISARVDGAGIENGCLSNERKP